MVLSKQVHKIRKATKEDEEEARKRKKQKEDEAEDAKKKPTREEDGKLIKENEAEDEDESEDTKKEAEDEAEDEDMEDEDEDEEEKRKKRKKARKEAEDEEEEEESEEESKEETEKGKGGGESPEESAASGTDANSSLSPGMGVPSTQNVYVPASGIGGERNASPGKATGVAPGDVGYSGKSARADLQKSPLFVGLSKEVQSFQRAIEKKMDAMEKSFGDRITNLNKTLKKVEEFYNRPLRKGFAENVSPEGTQGESISTQIEKGKVRYRE